ncbi:MAG: alpha-glucosidase C-terminal domain-containing protein, partial [Steroidobacteraceae bacterium]
IPMPQFTGLTPVEMLGQTEFPRIGDHPYFLTLAPYGFYWFELQEVHTSITARTAPVTEEPATVPALFAGVVWDSILDGSMRLIVERQTLVPFLQRQRWFGGKARTIASARFVDWAPLRTGAHPSFLTIVETDYMDGARERYLLPLAMSSGADAEKVDREFHGAVLARITGARKGLLYDGLFDDATCSMLLAAIDEGRVFRTRHGRVAATNHGLSSDRVPIERREPIARSAPDQSNTSVLFDRGLIMKLFRRVEPGPNPDVEISRHLMNRDFTRVPPLVGTLEYTRDGSDAASVAMLQEFVRNEGNGWQVTIDELGRYFERRAGRPLPTMTTDDAAVVRDAIGTYLNTAEVIGRRTGELHIAMSSAGTDDEAFAPDTENSSDIAAAAAAMQRHAGEQLDLLGRSLDRLDDRKRALAQQVLGRRDDLLRQFDELRELRTPVTRIRCHGDYHLGQLLVSEGDIIIL